MWLNGRQDGMKGIETAMQIAVETTLPPPFSLYSHSIVPGGFEVTS
jgi:hypothetical protein